MLYSEKLQELVEWLKAFPAVDEAIGEWEYPSIHLYFSEDEEADFSRLCRNMGPFTKNPAGGTLNATVVRKVTDNDKYGPTVFELNVNLSGACIKVPKVDDDGMPIMKTYPESVIPARTVQEYEYQCPTSWLNLGDSEHVS